jgi:hypothetical protein
MVLSLLPPSAQAQHTLSTLSLIERVANEKEPTCKLAMIYIRKSQQEDYAYLTWRCGEQEVRVDVNEYDSIEEARITPNSLMTSDPRGVTQVRSIGDEAYLLGEGLYGKGKFNVIFRKGKVSMNVTAQSSDLALRFARHFAELRPLDTCPH